MEICLCNFRMRVGIVLAVLLCLEGAVCFVPISNTAPTFRTTMTRRNEQILDQLVETKSDTAASSKTSTVVAAVEEAVPPGAPALNGDDDFFRKLRDTWPLWLQHGLRDSGGLGFIVDFLTRTVAAPAFYKEDPHCFPEFLRISGYPSWLVSEAIDRFGGTKEVSVASIDFSIESYGSHPRQYAEVMVPSSLAKDESLPLFCFVHGGAWGSGFTSMYRLLAAPFLERGYRVAILGYRIYPDADVDGQADDVAQGLKYLTKDSQQTILMGHSSGAHISLIAALRQQLPSDTIAGIICMSGVYNVEEHFEFEASRGVDQISPMAPACGDSLDEWRARSPTRLAATVDQTAIDALPPLLFVHGDIDSTVPTKSTADCHDAFAARMGKQSPVAMQILEGVDHAETVLETLHGGKTQDVVFQWIESLKQSSL